MPVYTLEPDDRSPPPAPPPRPRDWFGRPVRDVLGRPMLGVGIIGLVSAGLLFADVRPPVAWALGLSWVGLVAALGLTVVRPNARLLRAVRGFRTLDRPACVVHHCPTVHPTDVELAVGSFERNLADLERAFGFRLRFGWGRRARVYLFRTPAEVSRLYGPHTAYALPGVNGVVFSALGFSPELVRHETAHLFAFTAGGRAPRVLEEGLAMWAQRTHHGRGLHESARAAVRAADDPPDRLLPANWTDADAGYSYRCYTLAGSFTGYLIGRFGWPAYWRLYGGQTPAEGRFRRRFERLFGESFAAARADWLTRLRRGELTGTPAVGSFEVSTA